MEGMWTRFHPLLGAVRARLDAGDLGTLQSFEARFLLPNQPDPAASLFDPGRGGGALLHRGIYPLSLARQLMGPVEEMVTLARCGETGVDEESVLVLRHRTGAISSLRASLRTAGPEASMICGTAGTLTLAGPVYRPTGASFMPVRPMASTGAGRPRKLERFRESALGLRLSRGLARLRAARAAQAIRAPFAGNGYRYEALAVAEALERGQTEHPLMPLDESIEILALVDRGPCRLGEEDRTMKIGVIGCGYVFDHYMTTLRRHPELEIVGLADRNSDRAPAAGAYYGLKVHEDAAALLADPAVEIVANFTSIESHYEVSRAALTAGKHVYCEKPLTLDMGEAHALSDLARDSGLRLSSAPSNALSPTVRTLRKAVAEGRVGDVRMVYAEFDDNPVYLMQPETWVSRSGAPWPYLHEYEMGCTFEHVGYHLTWMCALFGPVRAVTAFSKHTLPDKTEAALDPADTPDFSVAALDFESGVVGARHLLDRGTHRSPDAHHRQSRRAGDRHLPRLYRAGLPGADPERALKARNLRMVRRSSCCSG
jgi:predicted dehydrogenase